MTQGLPLGLPQGSTHWQGQGLPQGKPLPYSLSLSLSLSPSSASFSSSSASSSALPPQEVANPTMILRRSPPSR